MKGALLGEQKGRHIEISNSFELLFKDNNELDVQYFQEKTEQCMETPSSLQFSGVVED